jgi:hypothetical protein
MNSNGVVAAAIRSSRGPAGGRCALLVANTDTCRQFRSSDLVRSYGPRAGSGEVMSLRTLSSRANFLSIGSRPPLRVYISAQRRRSFCGDRQEGNHLQGIIGNQAGTTVGFAAAGPCLQ